MKWAPIVAIGISLVSLILTFYFNSQQNAKWNQLNQPRIELKSVFFQPFAVFRLERELPNWGYENPLLFTGIENGLPVFSVLNDLVFWNPITNSHVIGAKRMLTLEECNEEARRLNLKNVEIKKRGQLKVSFLNAGRLPTQQVAAQIEFLINEAGSANPSWQGTPPIAELPGGNEFHVRPYLYLPLNALLPFRLKLRVSVVYPVKNKPATKLFPIMYDLESNVWNWD